MSQAAKVVGKIDLEDVARARAEKRRKEKDKVKWADNPALKSALENLKRGK